MNRSLKWLLLPALLLAAITLALVQQAEAGRVRVAVGYPGWYVGRPYAYGYYYPSYCYGPPVYPLPPVTVYRPTIVSAVGYRYAAAYPIRY